MASNGKATSAMIKVFLSYSHEDEALRAELDKHLGALKHQGIIATWSDHQVPVGSNWNDEILGQLEEANLILLLVSPGFINSRYCYVDEMKRAIERHKRREAIVLPILLRSCYWQVSPFAEIQGLPKGMVPVVEDDNTSRAKRDLVWSKVARGIHEAAIACDQLKGSSATKNLSRGASYPIITIAGMRAVDVVEIDGIINDFKKGDRIGIKWPNSSDQLISLMREAIRKFDEANATFDGADNFIRHAPEALANALRYREKFEQRLPELMNTMSTYGRQLWFMSTFSANKNAWARTIKYYLLWANFVTHREIGGLSSWAGLKHLGLWAPEAWIPFQGVADSQWLSKLYPEVGMYFTRIAINRLAGHDQHFSQYRVFVPREVLKEGVFRATEHPTIYDWIIPQLEMRYDGGFFRAPESYLGEWEGHAESYDFFGRLKP
jgi:hypothetical protein